MAGRPDGLVAPVVKFTCVSGGDEIVHRDVEVIRNFLVEHLGTKLVALVLCGSFGRGEGSMVEGSDGVLQPLNDYDFLVVVDGDQGLPGQSEVRAWERTCAGMVHIQFVDFAMTTEDRLAKMVSSQVTYDIKRGSVVLHGSGTILDAIPSFEPADIPIIDAQILLTTRHWCFIGILPVEILEAEDSLSEEDRNFAYRQLSKALIAAGDSELLRLGRYRTGYAEKAKLISSLDELIKVDKDVVLWGYHFKLGTCKSGPEGVGLRALFLHALAIHLQQVAATRNALPWQKRLGAIRGLKGVYAIVRRQNSRPLRGWVLDYLMLRILYKLKQYQGDHAWNGPDRLLLKICSGKCAKNLKTAAAVCAELRLL